VFCVCFCRESNNFGCFGVCGDEDPEEEDESALEGSSSVKTYDESCDARVYVWLLCGGESGIEATGGETIVMA